MENAGIIAYTYNSVSYKLSWYTWRGAGRKGDEDSLVQLLTYHRYLCIKLLLTEVA